jgi:hypothetical protein
LMSKANYYWDCETTPQIWGVNRYIYEVGIFSNII